jgi:hypothetical protein
LPRPMAITDRGSGSTVHTDSTTDALIGVLIIIGRNQQRQAVAVLSSTAAAL